MYRLLMLALDGEGKVIGSVESWTRWKYVVNI